MRRTTIYNVLKDVMAPKTRKGRMRALALRPYVREILSLIPEEHRMPSLNEEDIERMQKEPPRKCPTCQVTAKKNYCRQCDEFFYECNCNEHKGHRTY
jgi:hypothetical protein